jgi:hypothetical protein
MDLEIARTQASTPKKLFIDSFNEEITQYLSKQNENNSSDEIDSIFKNSCIYVEIFNHTCDNSDILDELILLNSGIISKKLTKTLSFIIFKDGREKTIEYALNNNIPILNPLFIHECCVKGKLLDIEKYRIKKTFTQFSLERDFSTKKRGRASIFPQADKKKQGSKIKNKVSETIQ